MGGFYVGAGDGTVDDNNITAGSNNPNSSYMGALSLDDDGAGISTLIYRNLITNSPIGISCTIEYAFNNKGIIENNTITNNTVGVQINGPNAPDIVNNNIYGNSYNAKLGGTSSQVNLPNNWWGTTDIQAINQTVYDFKYDFNLGTINFLPILEASNQQAAPNLTAPINTSSPTPSAPSQTASTNTPSPSHSSQPTPSQSSSPSPTSSATLSSTVSPSFSPKETERQHPTGIISTELLAILIAVVATIIVVVAVVAFTLGKRTGRKNNL